MQYQLLAMLVVAFWSEQKGDDRPPEPAGVWHVINVDVRYREESRTLRVAIPVPDDPRAARPIMPFALQTAVVEQENFDRWLFPRERSERARQERLEKILDAKIELAAVSHRLTASQRAKLRLAGRGDIKRFFDEIQKSRDWFEIDRKNFDSGFFSLSRICDDLSPGYGEGLFHSRSLFTKTLQKMVADRKPDR